MLKRWNLYCREMYPIFQGLVVAFILEGALYLLTALRFQIPFSLSPGEIVGFFTVFFFLLFLRIADDFKDEELDKRLFPHRPYPSGRVTKRDLQILMGVCVVAMVLPNLLFVDKISLLWFFALMAYMVLMSLWFFQKKRIQNNLLLALVTHNPCMLLLNYYLLSITCQRFHLPLLTFDFLCINLMLYIPALEFEISRKIRAPQEETAYVTYSKVLGLRGAVLLFLSVSLVEVTATIYMSHQLFHPVFMAVFAAYYLCSCINGFLYLKNPSSPYFHIGRFARGYIYVMQGTLILLAGYKLWIMGGTQ